MSTVDLLNTINDTFWYIPLVMIVALGLYSTLRLKGIQFKALREMVRVTFSKDSRSEGEMSSFKVFCMSMGNRIGVGNITGPVLAILVGGPGAIFWMWIFAILGGATSFLESTVGQIYKTRKSDGNFRGGPAYNIYKALGLKRMSIIVAMVMVLMYILGFASMEVSSMASALCDTFQFSNNNLFFAVILTSLTAIIIIGGIKRVADVSTALVPTMAIGWLILCTVSIAMSTGGVVNAFAMIFECAFSVPSAVGGGVGAMLIIGMKRGVLSNEAGIGTITNISSIADVEHPAKQGLSQCLGVAIDTVVGTLTAIVVLSYANYDVIIGLNQESMPLLHTVFESTLGGIAPMLVTLMLFVFAFTSLISDFIIGENNLSLVTEKRVCRYGMAIGLLSVVFLSSFYASDSMFLIVDIMLGICAVINCIVMFRIGKFAVEACKDYFSQRAAGVDTPIFHKSCLSDTTGVTEWDD